MDFDFTKERKMLHAEYSNRPIAELQARRTELRAQAARDAREAADAADLGVSMTSLMDAAAANLWRATILGALMYEKEQAAKKAAGAAAGLGVCAA